MKIGEYIELIRALEHDRLMLIKERTSIISQRFEDVVKIGSNATTAETLTAHVTFITESTSKIKELNQQIDQIMEKVIVGRTRINKRNTELGISEKLTRVKHIRIELSTLDKMVNNDRYDRNDQEIIRVAELRNRIKMFENAKRVLENEIKGSNYANDI
jgi:prefoldin subunit 5